MVWSQVQHDDDDDDDILPYCLLGGITWGPGHTSVCVVSGVYK